MPQIVGRGVWFSVHKWIGLILFLLLIPVSASGSLLVWHDWTDSLVNPQRYQVRGEASLAATDYIRSARTVLGPQDRIVSIEWPDGAGKPVIVTASPEPTPGERPSSGPPARYQVWLDPSDAKVLDHADPRTGILRTLHVFHGSLMVPEIGRQIVGWLGVLMLVSCLSGIWLWWPSIGSVLRGFRWKRGPLTSSNLHHQAGIWIVLPLAVLSFTGAYISFPNFFRGVEAWVSQEESKPGSATPNRRARPVAAPALTPDAAILAASGGTDAASPTLLRWPTEGSSEWTVTLRQRDEDIELNVDDSNAAAMPARSGGRSGTARFMRQLHDGHAYNPVWQTVIFIAGLIPALLGITGVIMWLRTRGWRSAATERQRSRRTA